VARTSAVPNANPIGWIIAVLLAIVAGIVAIVLMR
jgi:hypothetical protein